MKNFLSCVALFLCNKLCDGESRRTVIDAPKMFAKTFSQSTPSFSDVNGGAATAGDAINKSRGRTSKRFPDGNGFFWPPKVDVA